MLSSAFLCTRALLHNWFYITVFDLFKCYSKFVSSFWYVFLRTSYLSHFQKNYAQNSFFFEEGPCKICFFSWWWHRGGCSIAVSKFVWLRWILTSLYYKAPTWHISGWMLGTSIVSLTPVCSGWKLLISFIGFVEGKKFTGLKNSNFPATKKLLI